MKLIRDNYVKIIPEERLFVVDPKTTPDVFKEYVVAKIYEELDELAESGYKDITEYADVYEVFLKLMEINNVTLEEVINARVSKREQFGGFDDGLILRK